ncbi:hypothetical protein [Catenulispora acidiphila]|nr:hypothetical protein [Catenulispora acidiphila]
MQQERSWVYAACTVRLAPDQPGCEAVFDQALTNGLAAIVALEWPGAEANARGRVRSAAELLDVISERVPQDGQTGVYPIPDTSISQGLNTLVDVATLRDGVTQTQQVRHARGPGRLEERHVDALRALDHHRSLRSLSGEESDRVWDQAREDDRASILRAVAFLDLIGEDEAARRAVDVENPNAYHPKHNPDGQELEECPVCGLDTFCIQGIDDYGYGFGSGQCLVCAYVRSRDTADEMALDFHIARLSAKD